jgi:hypothetical protein
MSLSSPQRSETRTVSIAAPPRAVVDVVGDPRLLPSWAPAFASAVRRDDEGWLITTGGREARIAVRVSHELGTVDILAAGRPERGAFTRTIPNGTGSELVFTLCFPEGTDEQAIARQMDVVGAELEAVRALCEPGRP